MRDLLMSEPLWKRLIAVENLATKYPPAPLREILATLPADLPQREQVAKCLLVGHERLALDVVYNERNKASAAVDACTAFILTRQRNPQDTEDL